MEEGQSKEFAGGYTKTQRFLETGALLIFFGIETFVLFRLKDGLTWGHVVAGPVALFLGMLGADLLSGFVHWFCDTWGSIGWPIVGQSVLRTFREHHFDPKAITWHDFVETNGSNAIVGMIPMLCTLPLEPALSIWEWGATLCGSSMSFFVLMTSQIHKWSHSESPPSSIVFLQRLGLILSPEHHDVHHTSPYTHNYSITTGWTNPVFERLHIFSRLERAISFMTGVQPRYDPLSDQLAAEVLQKQPVK